MTVPMAKRAINGVVHAFEPVRMAAALLSYNVMNNHLTNVLVHRNLVGEVDGDPIPIPSGRQEPGRSKTRNYGSLKFKNVVGESDPVLHVRVDSLKLERCDFMKIDVEGRELGVLRGAADTIRRLRPYVYVEADNSDKNPAVFKYLLEDLKYRCFLHTPPLFPGPDNFNGNPINEFTDGSETMMISLNALCIPREKATADVNVDPSLFEDSEMSADGAYPGNLQIV